MPFSHDTGIYNVQGSLVAWLQAQINASPPPATGPLILVLDHPDQPVHLPGVSVHFLGIEPDPQPVLGSQIGGGQVGLRRFGQMEIDGWASRQDANWRAQLLQMQDVITLAVRTQRAAVSSLPVYDFYTNAAAPSVLPYRVFIGDVTSQHPPAVANPAVERTRIVIRFWWVERG
jgi:hypothetical protein